MATDGSKAQDGTMNATGTNNALVDFDTRKVGSIFIDFNRAINTINRYLKTKEVKGRAYGLKNEKKKEALITVQLINREDYIKVEKEIRAQLTMRREQMTAYDVELTLVFKDTHNEDVISEDVLEFD